MVLRVIIGKAVILVVKKEVLHAAGSKQVCAGQVPSMESTIHNMVDLLESDKFAAVVQIGVTNAFNSLSCNVFLPNVNVICAEI